MSEHAKLSPSGADRWKHCPGSVPLSRDIPDPPSSFFADEGTMMHAVAAGVLSGDTEITRIGDEVFEAIVFYVNYVRSRVEIGCVLHIETRVKLNDDVWGTTDAAVWNPHTETLEIIDLKGGKGVAVDVNNTLQLPIYGVAALKTFGYQAKQVICTIVQPRCPHPDGPVRSITLDVSDLLEFNADLEDAVALVREAERANDLEPYLHPSEKACRWCKAAAICPALKAKATAMAKKVFTPQLPYNLISLAETLEELPLIEAWIKNVREFAYQEAERGIDIPNHKLVEKIARRKWRDEGLVEDVFGGHALDLYEKKLISPAALEKLLPREERGKLDELTVKESSGHALVHESDKRPAVKVDAATAFANL